MTPVTFITQLALIPLVAVAVIVAEPIALAETKPYWSTFATDTLEVLQFKANGEASMDIIAYTLAE